jgi:acetyl esterase/lipase
MYRLVASPFLKLGMAVAIVGYRTWPDGNAKEQMDDLEQAASFLAKQFPGLCTTNVPIGENQSQYGTCLMGHSSGAHIALLMLVERARRKLRHTGGASTDPLEFHSYIGLSGPYDISHHFDYEAARGVEELSPMKPACGYSRDAFRLNSPALLLWMRYLTGISECDASIEIAFPRILLIHGIEDSTVPFTATAEAARILRSCGISQCNEMYVARIGHQDTVMEVMMGGKTRDSIIEWLRNPSGNVLRFVANSKL